MRAGGTLGLAHLGDITGEEHIVRDPSELAGYQVDGRLPAAAARPGSEEEVAAIVKFACREKLAIVVSGARTKLGMGAPPRQYDLALDMSRMDRILAYDPDDLTLAVEAGARLGTISSTLAERGQFLPLAVPFLARATMGGTMASGVDSPLRQSYGTARDFVLGMNFVTGEGITARSGGRVVKNVSGYDLHKMMIGSLGTLGAITRINLKTFPRPRATKTFSAAFCEAQQACAFRNALARSALGPRTLEIVSQSADGRFLLAGEHPPSRGARPWSVYVSFAGDAAALKRHYGELRSLAPAENGRGDWLSELEGQAEESLMSALWEFPAALLGRSPAAAILKITALPTELPELASDLHSLDLPWAVVMRGLGVAYLALIPPDLSEASLDRLRQQCARILALAGKPPYRQVSLPWCPGALKRDLDVWGPAPTSLALMKRLKSVFDPAGIFSPGRFVGGI
jgi:glycolate oxidase FAD binding subunit